MTAADLLAHYGVPASESDELNVDNLLDCYAQKRQVLPQFRYLSQPRPRKGGGTQTRYKGYAWWKKHGPERLRAYYLRKPAT